MASQEEVDTEVRLLKETMAALNPAGQLVDDDEVWDRDGKPHGTSFAATTTRKPFYRRAGFLDRGEGSGGVPSATAVLQGKAGAEFSIPELPADLRDDADVRATLEELKAAKIAPVQQGGKSRSRPGFTLRSKDGLRVYGQKPEEREAELTAAAERGAKKALMRKLAAIEGKRAGKVKDVNAPHQVDHVKDVLHGFDASTADDKRTDYQRQFVHDKAMQRAVAQKDFCTCASNLVLRHRLPRPLMHL